MTKTCRKCSETKDITDYPKMSASKDGLHSRCKVCIKVYNQSPKGIKSRRIKDWKLRGLIHTDWDNLYELYLKTDKCNKCKCEFIGTNKKCLDHDHTTGLFRNILCPILQQFLSIFI